MADAATTTFTLTRLKQATNYRLVAEAIDPGPPETKYSTDANSSLSFSTPSGAGGSVEDDLNAALGTSVLSVPCSK
jgi:hypothetical protein